MDVASDWMGWVSPGGVRYRALFGTNKINDNDKVRGCSQGLILQK